MTERKLATIRRIAEIKPIEGANAIEAVRVDGWWVVAKKDECAVDSLSVYLEIDSWVPTAIAPFLTKVGHEPKEFEGVKGERLRTIRLRGQVSQGLLLPLSILGGSAQQVYYNESNRWGVNLYDENDVCNRLFEGDDVTEILGILKYEKPLPACLAGMAKGNFPSFIPKTDQPRIQNLGREFEDFQNKHNWSVTEKLDGSSMTVYCKTEFENGFVKEQLSGVCSRNLDLKFDETNSFWEAAVKYDLINKIFSTGRNLAIQGELVGEGIQGNSYKLIGRQFFCFDIWDIDNQKYLLPKEMFDLCAQLDIQTVPEINREKTIKGISVADLLKNADGKSVIGGKPNREGDVYKSNTVHDVSFKAISDKWLLNGGE